MGYELSYHYLGFDRKHTMDFHCKLALDTFIRVGKGKLKVISIKEVSK